MTAYHLLLLLCPLVLVGALTRARDTNFALLATTTVVAVLFCGLRWNSDVDHEGYALLFDETPMLRDFTPENVLELYGEPGYLLLSSVLRSLGIGFFFLTFLSALVAITAKAVVAHHFVRSAAVVLFLYLCVHVVTIEIIQMRWAIASALIALAFLLQFRGRRPLALLCLVTAFLFHYFSIVFIVVALLMEIKRESRLYLVLALLGMLGASVAALGLALPEFPEVDAYILQRALRYINEPLSTLGLMSYVKVVTYPVAYVWLTVGRADLHRDATTAFLRRLSFTSIAFTLALSVVPVMHHRAVVIADLFSLMLVVRVVEMRFAALERVAVLTALALPFCTWFVLDIAANLKADTLYEYKTWIPLLF